MHLLEDRVTCMVTNNTPLLRDITLRPCGRSRTGKKSIDLEDTAELGDITETKPTLVAALVVVAVILAGDVLVVALVLVAPGAVVILASIICQCRRTTAEVRDRGHARLPSYGLVARGTGKFYTDDFASDA